MLEIRFEKREVLKEKPQDLSEIGFGKIFSDYMFVMDYQKDVGWHDPRIIPYQPLQLDPASAVFHYGQEVFEGLKAYYTKDGKIQLFRADLNAHRFKLSCERMCIPSIPEEDFIAFCKALVVVEKDWVPQKEDMSYYLRPFVFASDAGLGVHASSSYTFVIIGGIAGAYYASGLEPIAILVEDEYIRSAPGLTGFAKCGGNYGASILASENAAKLGFSQVLWLDGIEKRYVEEVGAMNIFFKIAGKIYTAPCNGTVLDGVTRRSCIELLTLWGYEVIEGKLAIDDIYLAYEKGELEEIFGTGTAAVISPVGKLSWKNKIATAGDGNIGKVTKRLYNTLTAIQFGRMNDPYGWIIQVLE